MADDSTDISGNGMDRLSQHYTFFALCIEEISEAFVIFVAAM